MRKNKIIAMLMTVTLLAGSVQLFGIRTRAIGAVPEVTISGVNVTSDGTASGEQTGYLELSLHVSGEGFQTVGAVVSYDSEVLTPVDWVTGEPVNVSSTLWTTVVPTKGADEFSGKPALARLAADPETAAPEEGTDSETEAENEEHRGYLYFGAESLVYRDLPTEDDTRLVTVRFEIAQGADGSYLPVTVPGENDELTDTKYTLCLAPEAIGEWSAAGAQVQLTCGEPTGETDDSELNPGALDGYVQQYYAWRSTESKYVEYGESACNVVFRTGPGKTINTGTTTQITGDYAITFFDWDGRVIDAIAGSDEVSEEQLAQIKRIEARLNDPADMGKKGYTFDGWLIVEQTYDGSGLVTKNGTFTSNDTKLDRSSAAVAEDILDFRTEKLSEGSFTETSVLVQAAYYARTTPEFSEDLVNGGGTDNTDRYYTISEPTYTRYGAADSIAGSYSLTMTVTRANGDNGVTRLREPAIWVAMTPAGGGANIMNLIRLENTDETTFEIVTTKQISSVTYKVIDVYGISNWPGCADRSDVTQGVRDRNTCITLGTQGYLAEQAYAVYQGGSWEATVNNWAFADCYYNNGTQSGKAAATWWTDARCETAKNLLLTATQRKGSQLTYAEVLTALAGVS